MYLGYVCSNVIGFLVLWGLAGDESGKVVVPGPRVRHDDYKSFRKVAVRCGLTATRAVAPRPERSRRCKRLLIKHLGFACRLDVWWSTLSRAEKKSSG